MKQITIDLPCKGYFHMGVFTSDLASSLTTQTIPVTVVDFDPVSKYCNLEVNGQPWPCAHINAISFNP